MLRQYSEIKMPAEYEKKVESCRFTLCSNCAGTTLYLLGVIDTDREISTYLVYADYLSKMQRLDAPVPGCIIAFNVRGPYGIETKHMGVVTATFPYLLMTHRDGTNGRLIEDQPLKRMRGRHAAVWLGHIKAEYYMPNTPNLK